MLFAGNNDNNGSSLVVTLAGVVHKAVLFPSDIGYTNGHTFKGKKEGLHHLYEQLDRQLYLYC